MHEPQPSPHTLVKLRDFTAQLAEKLREAPNQPAPPSRLAIRIGARNFLVDMALASEIVAVPDIARVPWTRPWFRGLANVRGRLVGVVDLQLFAGGEPQSADAARQVLVFGDALGVNAALLVSRAFGLRNLKSLQPVEAERDPPRWEKQRYLDADGTLLTELDLRELVAAPGFAAIGA